MADLVYTVGAELPSATFTWRDDDGDLIDFSTGWTWSLRLALAVGVADLVKTTGITGAATDPNITVAWAADELAALAPGLYSGQLWATRTADSKDRVLPFSLRIAAAITTT